MRLVVRGRELPGRQFAEFGNVHVGLQVGSEPVALVPGDAAEAAWETAVEFVDGADYRGEAVHGLFRRAKLMLADIPTALRAEPVVGVEVPLTQDDGSPRCARIPADLPLWTREVR